MKNKFIRLYDGENKTPVRINVERIEFYRKSPWADESNDSFYDMSQRTLVYMGNAVVYVRETVEEIDRLLEV